MIKGAIIADDLTGALDCGAMLSSVGCATVVLVEWTSDLPYNGDDETQVVVVNSDSRHLQPMEAYSRIYTICDHIKRAGVELIYKKTDSALRGNVGVELSALLDHMKAPIIFAPAFPDMRRYLIEGTVFIDGISVDQSIFGTDPFNPVKHSHIQDILRESADRLPIYVHNVDDDIAAFDIGIHAMNASTNTELRQIAIKAKQADITLYAGCAGFANHLPYIWGLKAGVAQIPRLPRNLLIFSGSMSLVTINQLNRGRSLSIDTYTITECLASPDVIPYAEILRSLDTHHAVIVEAVSSKSPSVSQETACINEETRSKVAENLGETAAKLIGGARDCLPLVIGGDTLIALMQKVSCQRLYPITSVSTGTILALADTCHGRIPILTKSGGLGPPDMIETLLAFIQANRIDANKGGIPGAL